eukprot:COSAG05_NODE_921_length_6590_cov_2.081985_8_plen_207_part_00
MGHPSPLALIVAAVHVVTAVPVQEWEQQHSTTMLMINSTHNSSFVGHARRLQHTVCGYDDVVAVNAACCAHPEGAGHRRTQAAEVCSFPTTCTKSCAKQFVPFMHTCAKKLGVPAQFNSFLNICDPPPPSPPPPPPLPPGNTILQRVCADGTESPNYVLESTIGRTRVRHGYPSKREAMNVCKRVASCQVCAILYMYATGTRTYQT